MIPQKQMKITKMIQKKVVTKRLREDEELKELEEEVKQLQQERIKKHYEWFMLMRNQYKQNSYVRTKKKEKVYDKSHITSEALILETSVQSLRKKLDLMTMLTGIEIQSYVPDDHCCIVYHLQHDAHHEVKHGLRFNMKSGEAEIEKKSLPIGFNIKAIIEEFGQHNMMKQDCLRAIRRGLVAYYERREQFEELNKMLIGNAGMFRLLDGTHMNIWFVVQKDCEDNDDDKELNVELILEYRVYDIMPKKITFNPDIPEPVAEMLHQQCSVFKREPLAKAFKEAFLVKTGGTRYLLVRQVLGNDGDSEICNRIKVRRPQPTEALDLRNSIESEELPPRARRQKTTTAAAASAAASHRFDDIFRVEDSSEASEDDE